jgi:Transposase and inactivated derivatives
MLLQIPLDIPDVKIEKFDASTKKGFVITVISELKGTICKCCGKPIDKFYGYSKEITLRHLPILEKPVWLKIKPKRYQCPYCDNGPTTTQACSWYDSKSPHTKAYEQSLLRDLINSTITDVSMKRGIGEAAVEGIINRHIHQQVDWQKIKAIPLLGIDEIALKKGHKDFVVIISAINEQGEKHILAVLPDRKKDTVKAFLAAIPAPQRATIQRVCVDMYEGYSNAVYETLPGVAVVVDRFHVAKNYRGCADKARKQEMQALKKTLSNEEYAELKGVMWLFRKNWTILTEEQQTTLLLLFSYSPILKQVYIFREILTSIFNSPLTKVHAVIELGAWIKEVQELGLSCFDSFVGTLQKWMDEISNYFIQRQSSGFVEGLNNKIKVIKRRCYGIYDLGRLFQHIWLDVEGRRLFGYAKHYMQ